MSHTRNPLLSALALLAFCSAAQSCLGQQSQPSADNTPESSRYELLVQYAKTNLDLAKVELQQAVEINAESSGAIPRLTIERLRSNVAVAKEQLSEAELASYGGQERVRLRHAEEKIRVAKLALDAGRKQAQDGFVTELELQRLQLRYDLARLSLTLIKNPENFVTLLHRLEAQVNRLSEEILAIDQRISKFEPLRY